MVKLLAKLYLFTFFCLDIALIGTSHRGLYRLFYGPTCRYVYCDKGTFTLDLGMYIVTSTLKKYYSMKTVISSQEFSLSGGTNMFNLQYHLTCGHESAKTAYIICSYMYFSALTLHSSVLLTGTCIICFMDLGMYIVTRALSLSKYL